MKYSEIIKSNNLLEANLSGQEYNICILSNIMVHQSKDICEWILRSESLNAKVTLGEYDNIVQDAKKFQGADAVVIFWEACNIIDGLHYKIDFLSDNSFNEIIEKVKTEIDLIFLTLKETPTVIVNRFSSLIFDQFNFSKSRLNHLTNVLNIYLENQIKKNIILFNVDEVISRLSINTATDLRYFYSSKTLYSIEFYKEYFEQSRAIFLARVGSIKKALIFDCDNTLWKGTIGEDGLNSIQMFQEVQYLALKLAKNGVLIGLCSKNNYADIENVLENHPDMILKNKDITIKEINWENKALNLNTIAEKLNIGLDSMVFIDDSSFEIGLVNQELPAIKTYHVPVQGHEYILMMKKIENLFFNPFQTHEDALKTQMYKEQAKRIKEKSNSVDLESYLTSLDMSVTVHINDIKQVSRISQLTQKTNQFNLTTKRYSEVDIENYIKDENKILITLEVNDKYGSSGITGLAILCQINFEIDTLLLSCRVLGRNIEFKFMEIILNTAKEYNFKYLNASFIRSLKNTQVENFYTNCNFNQVQKTDDFSRFSLDLSSFNHHKIKYIRVKYGKKN